MQQAHAVHFSWLHAAYIVYIHGLMFSSRTRRKPTQPTHTRRFQVQRGNAWDARAWGHTPDMRHTHVVMMEVLDNLPHDRCVCVTVL